MTSRFFKYNSAAQIAESRVYFARPNLHKLRALQSYKKKTRRRSEEIWLQ